MQEISLVSPFINTKLYTTVALHPSQLNNNIYSNIKQNLIKMYEKRIYLGYGYINKVYEILERNNGNLVAENNDAMVFFKIQFSCMLCYPLEGTQIISKIVIVSSGGIFLERFPMRIIITNSPDRINDKVFSLINNDKIIVKSTNEELVKGTFVKITILSKIMVSNEMNIIVIGRLDDIANETEIETMYEQEYSQDKKPIIDYNEYVKQFD